MEVVIASSSSPGDGAISAWELSTGAEQQPRHKDCSSPPHGLASVGGCFLASSQSRDPSAPSGSVFYWSWEKPQVEVKSFPAEPIGPLIVNEEGTFIIGGGVSGEIYLWEVPTGRLLRKWHAHYRGVTCLVFSDDGSLVISGSEDGSVRVWSLYMMFDDLRRQEASHPYVHNFTGHNLRVNDAVCGYGGSNSIIISASEDRTCKVWSLSKGILLRNVLFPSVINAISLDPGEHVFYAGSRDGKIYIAALNAESNSKGTYGMHIIGSLSDYSKGVTCLTHSIDGNLLVSGSEDGLVKVWDIRSGTIVRMLKHSKGPVNNVLITRKQASSNPKSSRKHGSLLPPPLQKYESSGNGDLEGKSLIRLSGTQAGRGNSYITTAVMNRQIEEFQRQGSAANEIELERLKSDQKTSMQLVHKWQQMFDNVHQFCIDELLDKDMAHPPGTA